MGWGGNFVGVLHVVFPPGKVLGQCLRWQDDISMYLEDTGICV